MNSQLCMYIEIQVCKMLLCKSLQKCGMHSYEVTNRVWTIRNVNYALIIISLKNVKECKNKEKEINLHMLRDNYKQNSEIVHA